MARRRKPPRRRAGARARSAPRRSTRAATPASRPIPGPDAFGDLREPNHVRSQAATLLLIGAQLRGDVAAMRARAEAAMAIRSTTITVVPEAVPGADIDALGFPRLPVGATWFRSDQLQQAHGVRFAATLAPEPRHVTHAWRPGRCLSRPRRFIETPLRRPRPLCSRSACGIHASWCASLRPPRTSTSPLTPRRRSASCSTVCAAAICSPGTWPHTPSPMSIHATRSSRRSSSRE